MSISPILDMIHLELLQALSLADGASDAWGHAELAKRLGYKSDAVKKRLNALRVAGLVQVIEQQPKRYRIDPFCLRDSWVPPHQAFSWPDSPYSSSDELLLAIRDWLQTGKAPSSFLGEDDRAFTLAVSKKVKRKQRYY